MLAGAIGSARGGGESSFIGAGLGVGAGAAGNANSAATPSAAVADRMIGKVFITGLQTLAGFSR
jgi:hypothetical protein